MERQFLIRMSLYLPGSRSICTRSTLCTTYPVLPGAKPHNHLRNPSSDREDIPLCCLLLHKALRVAVPQAVLIPYKGKISIHIMINYKSIGLARQSGHPYSQNIINDLSLASAWRPIHIFRAGERLKGNVTKLTACKSAAQEHPCSSRQSEIPDKDSSTRI